VSGVFYAALAALVWPPDDSADSGGEEDDIEEEDDEDDAQTVILNPSPFSSPGENKKKPVGLKMESIKN
jgi:hypothetical protein